MKRYTILTEDGFRVAVTEGGSGIPLVFLHGLSVSAEAYTEMLELLAENGFHVFAFDAPDHGGSDSLPWGHTVKDMAEVIFQATGQIPALRWSQIVLVGHSMGGWIAAEYAAMRPTWVKNLILLDSAVGTEFHSSIKYEIHPTAIGRAAKFAAGALKDIFGDARKAKSLRTLSERLSLISRLGSSVSGPGIARAVYAMMKSDSADALHELKRAGVRTHIVHGSEDGIVPWKAARSTSYFLQCPITCLIGRYHSWMISDPELALDVIRDAVYLTPNEDGAA